VFVIMFLMPPFYTLMTSLKSSAEISAQTGSPWLVKHPTLENFWYLITYPNFQTYYLNSVMITILTVSVSMVISVLAAFSLARMGFHVVALDLRDHGRLRGQSPPPSLGIHEGRDVLAAAMALSDKEGVSVGVLGISYGGHCAVRAAHEATQAGRTDALRGGVLALSAPLHIQEAICALDDTTRRPQPHGFMSKLISRNLDKTLDRHLHIRIREKGHLEHPVIDFESYIREIVLPAYPDAPNLVGALLGAARCTQPTVLGQLAVPVAVVHAADDFLVPVSHLKEAAREARDNPWVTTRELPAGGHAGFGAVDPAGTLGMLAAFFGTLRDG